MKKECSICREEFDFVYKKNKQLPQHFPFCSSRCKQIDLSRWLHEKYHISSPIMRGELTAENEEGTTNFLPDEINGDYTNDE